MRGHPYVKSAIDMACWDLLGKAAGLPVATLMGGHVRRRLRALPRDLAGVAGRDGGAGRARTAARATPSSSSRWAATPTPTSSASARRRPQLEPGDVLIADANTGWTQHAAIRVADAVRDVDVYIEQPCMTYEQCLAVRRHTNRPFVLDEVVDGIDMVVRGVADQAMDVINLKISKVGGLTKARQIRDLCVSLGIAMTIEDTWGGDIITAAIAHLAHSTPERFLFSVDRLQFLRHGGVRRRRAAAAARTARRVTRAWTRRASR